MGQHADDALEDCFIYDDLVGKYHDGKLSDQEAYEEGIINEMGGEEQGHINRLRRAQDVFRGMGE